MLQLCQPVNWVQAMDPRSYVPDNQNLPGLLQLPLQTTVLGQA